MHKCYKCDKMAVWYYMPADKLRIEMEYYYCDNCVPRGCSCNIISYPDDMPQESYEYYKDELGRDLPCIEYEFCEIGYDETDTNK